ncbi:MAG: hypothetical protein JNL28_09175 [Planctomycetes bacterium]|nr:hypothetical protein [Planctomycetota bacterium]
MSSPAEREAVLAQLDDIERGLRAVLASLEVKTSPSETVDRAIDSLVSLPFDAQATIDAFREGSESDLAQAKAKLMRVADLDAVVRNECERLLAATAHRLERTRVLRTGLDGLADTDSTGDSIDCIR